MDRRNTLLIIPSECGDTAMVLRRRPRIARSNAFNADILFNNGNTPADTFTPWTGPNYSPQRRDSDTEDN